jgi:hypothetical protein
VQLVLGLAVAAQLLVEPVERLGAAVPLQQQIDRATRCGEDELGVGADGAAHACAEAGRGRPRPKPGDDPDCRIAERRGDQVGDEAVDLQPVCELRVRGPVVAALPVELAAVEVEAGGHQVGAGLVEQLVRLRLAGLEPRLRIEAIEHALPIQKQQPILGSTLRREEQQRQLLRGQDLLVVEAERDLSVALGQMPRQLEDAVGADAPSARERRSRLTLNIRPSLSEFRLRSITLPHAPPDPSAGVERRCR